MLKLQTIQAKLIFGFALGPIILAIIGWVAYASTVGLVDSLNRQQHSYQVLQQAEIVAKILVDAETGQRGFLLTNAERYLQPYTAAIAALGPSITRLGDLTADNPRQQTRLPTLRELVRQKTDELAETIAIRREKGADAALAVVLTDRGKNVMDEIRTVLDQFETEENNLLAQRSAEVARTAQLTFNSIIFGTLGSFVLLALVGFVVGRSIAIPINKTVEALSSASAEILSGTSQQAAGMREHSSAVTQTVSTVDEVLQTSEQAAQRAKTVSESSQRAAEVSVTGRKAVEDSVSAMGTVRDQTGSIAESILTLAEQAQAIGEIIATVNDVAEQINLLSLNAAIEAARAGEHGRGFSVVAAEIKALADQSKKATTQVRQILGEIQKATNTAVMATEQGTKSVSEAIKTVNEAGATIRMLADIIGAAAQSAAQIAASSGQQATGMRQIHQAMQNISQVSNQHLAATNQSEQAARHLTVLGAGLRQLVAG
jgi:methyl-accepting chemotaxis protein